MGLATVLERLGIAFSTILGDALFGSFVPVMAVTSAIASFGLAADMLAC